MSAWFELWLLQNFSGEFLCGLGSMRDVATKLLCALAVYYLLMKPCMPFSACRAGAFWPGCQVWFLTLVLAHNQACPEPADGEEGFYLGSWLLRAEELTCSKHVVWKPWSKSYCGEWRTGEVEAAQSFRGKWIKVVASVSVSGLEWSAQESSRSHFMAELNADEALLPSSTEHLCLHASVSWPSLCVTCAPYRSLSPFTFSLTS